MVPIQSKFVKGQSIVIVALIMLALVGLTALALDGGYAFWDRRIAQNAADAGALAGAYELCSNTLTPDVNGVASSYVIKNKGLVNEVSWNTGTKTVSVTTDVSFDSFFAGVIGYDVITVTAKAVAKCSPACGAQGVLPIAWSCAVPVGGVTTNTCELKFEDHPADANPGCQWNEDNYYIVADTRSSADDVQCADPYPAPGGTGFIDCDINDDGTNDLDLLMGGSKAWLDLTGQSGSSDLREWIQYGFPGTVKVHVWYPAQTGAVDRLYQDTETYHNGDIVAIPVYNYFWRGDPGQTSNPNWHTSPQDGCVPEPCPPGNTSADYYHVISFAAFHVTCVYSGGSSPNCPGRNWMITNDPTLDGKGLKTIEGCFVDHPINGAGSVGPGCLDTGAYAVQLVK